MIQGCVGWDVGEKLGDELVVEEEGVGSSMVVLEWIQGKSQVWSEQRHGWAENWRNAEGVVDEGLGWWMV